MDIIRKVFSDHQISHEYSADHFVVKIKVAELLKINVVNWTYNRPADGTRCSEIKDYLSKPSTVIDIFFHLHYNEKYNEFECLDGIHRYTALTMVDNKELINDKIVFAHIYFKKSEGELIDIFKNINKSITVPELYISKEYSLSDREIIQTVVNEWKDKYESHFSPSKDFRVPQMNRDFFIDFLTSIFNEYKIRNKKTLLELLNKANECVKEYLDTGYSHPRRPIKFSPKQLEKCQKSGCYLFLYKDSTLKEYFFPRANERIKTIH